MKRRTTLKVLAGPIEPTALIDVVFLLLIFFMISSSLVFWPGTRVHTRLELPRAYAADMTAADKIIITLNYPGPGSGDDTGLLFLNDMPVDWPELKNKLAEMARESRLGARKRAGLDSKAKARLRAPVVVLRADRRISYEKIVQVITLARSLGLDVYLATETAADNEAEPRGPRAQ